MSDKRIIKKYPNRRLYDTAESKYITLEDVRRLVIEEIPFAVIDKKTGEDITRNILLQIIIEQEDFGEPMFSTDALQKMIGFYGNSFQSLASGFFERSLSMLKEQHGTLQAQVQKSVGSNPLAALSEMTQQNIEIWRKMQEDFLRAAMGGKPAARKEPEDKP